MGTFLIDPRRKKLIDAGSLPVANAFPHA